MAEHAGPHLDLTGYLIGELDLEERKRFERHLATCESCRAQLGELSSLPGLLSRAADPFTVPERLERRVLKVIEREAYPRAGVSWVRRAGAAAVVAAVLATAVVAGVEIGERRVHPRVIVQRPPVVGELEVRTRLRNPEDVTKTAVAEVREIGIGRVIDFRSDELPILPKGEFYELWFVAPDDSFDHPNRISAGTFHPDKQGRSRLKLTAAVDPKKYPVISVTAEPRGGNPAWEGPELLRSDVPASRDR